MRSPWFALVALLGLLSIRCSLYESEGRKYLEHNLSSIGVSVQSNVQSCGHETSSASWIPLDQRRDAKVFALEGEDYKTRVVPQKDETFHCEFKFESAKEMYEKIEASIELTQTELNSPAPKASDSQ